MHITLRQIRAFLSVAELKSFTKAGLVLNISQSAVSSLIHELEEQVGVALFHRTSRNVTLSHEGERFMPVVQKASEELNHVEIFAKRLQKQGSGHVSIAGSPMICCSLLPTVIAHFSQVEPGIHVHLRDVHMVNMNASIIDEEIDFAIGPQWPPDSKIHKEKLFSTQIFLACRPDHAFSGKTFPLEQVKHERIIAAAKETLNYFSPDIMSSGKVHIEQEVGQMSTAFALAAAGQGIVFNSAYSLRMSSAFGLVPIPLASPKVWQDIVIFSRKNRKFSPASLKFLQFLRKFIQKYDPNEEQGYLTRVFETSSMIT